MNRLKKIILEIFAEIQSKIECFDDVNQIMSSFFIKSDDFENITVFVNFNSLRMKYRFLSMYLFYGNSSGFRIANHPKDVFLPQGLSRYPRDKKLNRRKKRMVILESIPEETE